MMKKRECILISIIIVLVLVCIFLLSFRILKRGKTFLPEMVAYEKFLSENEEIQWSDNETIAAAKLLFAVYDFDGDGIQELVLQNEQYCFSCTPRQKIYKYSEEEDALIIFWESCDAYELIDTVDRFSDWFITKRGVKGTFSTNYYDNKGNLRGQKNLWEEPGEYDKLGDEIKVSVRHEWDGKKVEVQKFEQEVFNLAMYQEGTELFFAQNNSKERRRIFR